MAAHQMRLIENYIDFKLYYTPRKGMWSWRGSDEHVIIVEQNFLFHVVLLAAKVAA